MRIRPAVAPHGLGAPIGACGSRARWLALKPTVQRGELDRCTFSAMRLCVLEKDQHRPRPRGTQSARNAADQLRPLTTAKKRALSAGPAVLAANLGQQRTAAASIHRAGRRARALALPSMAAAGSPIRRMRSSASMTSRCLLAQSWRRCTATAVAGWPGPLPGAGAVVLALRHGRAR